MGYEKMTLLDFMTWFLSKQTKGWLIREILNFEVEHREAAWFKDYWNDLAETCAVEIVNLESDFEPPASWGESEEE